MSTPAGRWLRVAALAALLALAFHGGAALGHHHDADGDQDCVFCHSAHVAALAPDAQALAQALPTAELPASEAVGLTDRGSRELPPLRGPPAV